MSGLPSTTSLTTVPLLNGSSPSILDNLSLSRLSTSSSEKLKSLKLTKKEAQNVSMQKEVSSSRLINTWNTSHHSGGESNGQAGGNSVNSQQTMLPDFEELVVTIKKSERGFGFDLKMGILVQNVYPSKIEKNIIT